MSVTGRQGSTGVVRTYRMSWQLQWILLQSAFFVGAPVRHLHEINIDKPQIVDGINTIHGQFITPKEPMIRKICSPSKVSYPLENSDEGLQYLLINSITHMLHVWYIYLHDWVILFGQMLVNIPAPWSIWVRLHHAANRFFSSGHLLCFHYNSHVSAKLWGFLYLW